jgi:VanZ family protein
MIFSVSSLSEPDEQLPSFLQELSDKVLHLVEYGIFAALWYRAFRSGADLRISTSILLAILASSLYGITDEFHQAFVPLRESSPFDWIADTAGAVLGAVGMSWVQHRSRSLFSTRTVGQSTPIS